MGICLGTSPACLLRVPAPLLLPAVCCSASRQAALTLGHLLQRRLSPARAPSQRCIADLLSVSVYSNQCHMEKIVHRRASFGLRRARALAARNSCRASATGPPTVALPRVARFLLAPSVALPRVARFLLAPSVALPRVARLPHLSSCTQDSNLELCADSRLDIDFPLPLGT